MKTGILYKPRGIEGAKMQAVTYQFLSPVRVRVRHSDGSVVLTGYGIGEKIQVLEASDILLIPRTELRDTIPLADGSVIIEFPGDMEAVMVCGE